MTQRLLNGFVHCECSVTYISGYTHCPKCGKKNPHDKQNREAVEKHLSETTDNILSQSK